MKKRRTAAEEIVKNAWPGLQTLTSGNPLCLLSIFVSLRITVATAVVPQNVVGELLWHS